MSVTVEINAIPAVTITFVKQQHRITTMTSRGKRHALKTGSSELLFVVGQGYQQVAAVI